MTEQEKAKEFILNIKDEMNRNNYTFFNNYGEKLKNYLYEESSGGTELKYIINGIFDINSNDILEKQRIFIFCLLDNTRINKLDWWYEYQRLKNNKIRAQKLKKLNKL